MPPKPHAPPPKGKPVAKKDDAADKKARKKDVAVAGSEDTGPERIKPSKQVQGLTDADLSKEITRVLSAKDPNAPDNVSRFSFKDRQFKLDAAVEQMFTHFEMEGCLVHKETEEGRRITNEIESERSAAQRAKENELVTAAGAAADLYDREDDSKQLRNQFNFSERASQTFNQPLRERGTVTEPPPSISFSATATQWEIFDACVFPPTLTPTRFPADFIS
jgi:dynein intermediate chain 1